jgi:hypothetical protein
MASMTQPQRRRWTRLHLACRIIVSGKDAEGREFTEETETLNVNKFGASIRTSRSYSPGQVITVRTKDQGHVGQFQVVWVGEPETPQAGRIGVEFLDARRFWGVEFPPDDWGGL